MQTETNIQSDVNHVNSSSTIQNADKQHLKSQDEMIKSMLNNLLEEKFKERQETNEIKEDQVKSIMELNIIKRKASWKNSTQILLEINKDEQEERINKAKLKVENLKKQGILLKKDFLEGSKNDNKDELKIIINNAKIHHSMKQFDLDKLDKLEKLDKFDYKLQKIENKSDKLHEKDDLDKIEINYKKNPVPQNSLEESEILKTLKRQPRSEIPLVINRNSLNKKTISATNSPEFNKKASLRKSNSARPSKASTFKNTLSKESTNTYLENIKNSINEYKLSNQNIQKKEILNLDKKDLMDKYLQIHKTFTSSNNTKNSVVSNNSFKSSINVSDINAGPDSSRSDGRDRVLMKRNKVEDSLSDNDDKEYVEKIKILQESRYYIDPDNKYKYYWDMSIILITLYSLIFTPYYIAFFDDDIWSLIILEAIFDFVFIIDLFVNFFVAYYNYEEELVKNLSLIAMNYLKTWFVFDAVSSIPGSIIVLIINLDSSDDIKGKKFTTINKATRFARFYRIIKFTKMFKIVKISKSDESKKFKVPILEEMNLTSSLHRFLIFIYSFLVVSHMITCIWIFLGKSFQPSWISFINLQDATDMELYVASLYFHWTTIFTVGYGDITAVNTIEKVYTMFLLFVGILVYSFAVSSLGNIFSKYDNLTTRYHKNREILEELRVKYKLPEVSYQKLAQYLKYDLKFNKNERFLFITDLPPKLKQELLTDMYKDIIKNFIFFQCATAELTAKIVFCMRPMRTYRKEYLVIEGEYIEEVYFIRRGVLSLHLGAKYNECKIMEIRSNEHFGDILLITNERSPITLKVHSKVADLLIIRKQDFIDIAQEFREVFEDSIIVSYYNYSSLLELLEKKKKKFEKEMEKQENYYKFDESTEIISYRFDKENSNDTIHNFKNNFKDINISFNSKDPLKNKNLVSNITKPVEEQKKEIILESQISEIYSDKNSSSKKSLKNKNEDKNKLEPPTTLDKTPAQEKLEFPTNILPHSFNLSTSISGIPIQIPVNINSNMNDNEKKIQSTTSISSGTFNFNFIIQNNNYINGNLGSVGNLNNVASVGNLVNLGNSATGSNSNLENNTNCTNTNNNMNNNHNNPNYINENKNDVSFFFEKDESKKRMHSHSPTLKSRFSDDININYSKSSTKNVNLYKNKLIKLSKTSVNNLDNISNSNYAITEESINKALDIKNLDDIKFKKYLVSVSEAAINSYQTSPKLINKIPIINTNKKSSKELDHFKNYISTNYNKENEYQTKKIMHLYGKICDKFNLFEKYQNKIK